ncbi:growth inhibitor PemK [Azospirillum sp. sgz302134]
MPIPPAEPGLVIRYDYLWHRRHEDGAGTADKARPACVVLVLRREGEETRVLLLPITHSEPSGAAVGVEIPPKVKEHLGLDQDRSWVIVSEANLDVWPSPDMQPVPTVPGRFHYGYLPPRLFQSIRDAFLTVHRERRARLVKRDSPETDSPLKLRGIRL